MSIKTVLVHVDDGAGVRARVELAARLAHDAGARLIGVYLVPTAEITPSVAALIPGDVLARRMGESARAQKAGAAMFGDATFQTGLSTVEWRAPAGNALEAAVVHGRCSDLMVIGQPDPDDPFVEFSAELATATLLGIGQPILVIPYIGVQGWPGKRILVATDGGREAARAIGDAMFLLERASAVKILVGTPGDPERSPSFMQTSHRLTGWFRDHDIEPDVERYDAEGGDHGEWLLSRAADFGADLIAMGGYGHPRLRETILGGMTRTVLNVMPVPVLMSH